MDEREPDKLDEAVGGEPYGLEDLEAEEVEEPRRSSLNADLLLDKVIPGEIDWRDLVRGHPLIAVGVAAGVGFLLGRSKGGAIVAGISAGISAAVMRQLSDVFEGEVFEF